MNHNLSKVRKKNIESCLKRMHLLYKSTLVNYTV